jgi:hypothetical protein
MPTVSVFLCVRKLHESLRWCVILSEVERSATKSKNPVELPKSTATGSLDFARDDEKASRSWEQAAHLFGLDDALNADRHRGCAMRDPVVLRASDYLHKRMLENAEKFVGHF